VVMPRWDLSFLTVVESCQKGDSVSMPSLLLYISSYLRSSAARSGSYGFGGSWGTTVLGGQGVRREGNCGVLQTRLLRVLLAKCNAGSEFLHTPENMLSSIQAIRPITQICGDLLSVTSRPSHTRLHDHPRHSPTSMNTCVLPRRQHIAAAELAPRMQATSSPQGAPAETAPKPGRRVFFWTQGYSRAASPTPFISRKTAKTISAGSAKG
jgi:hypothetical protein